MIPVTKPFLPPIEEYNRLVAEIWDREHITNNGPLVQQLEKELTEYLDVHNILYVNNGTIAIQIAIKALDLQGEIITTPFSYVATTSSIVWENCTPVFVDIDEHSFNINPELIEEAITDKTTAILATHVFGNPCEIEQIQQIAEKHGLKVIYDAAHCFGTKYKGKSVFNYGDVSTTSFHATKLFQTIEGGAIFAGDPEVHKRMWYMRNFGHNGPEAFNGVGINGKNSEFHAAMGVCNLKYISKIIDNRKRICSMYDEGLKETGLQTIQLTKFSDWNYAYYPLVFNNEMQLLHILKTLNEHDIFPRRYFYPSLDSVDYVESANVPVTKSVASRILCLPLFFGMSKSEQRLIITLIKEALEAK